MVCPECGGEYRDGFFQCADCGVALVDELPPPLPAPPDHELVTVLETGDPAEVAFVESLLRDAGIPFYKKGDSLQDLFALGRLGSGFSLIAGPVAFQVTEENAEAATELLSDLPAEKPEDPDELAEDD